MPGAADLPAAVSQMKGWTEGGKDGSDGEEVDRGDSGNFSLTRMSTE